VYLQIAIILTLILVTACSTFSKDNKLLLHWSDAVNKTYRYDVTIKKLGPESDPKLDYRNALQDRESFKLELSKIKRMKLGESNHIAVVSSKNGLLEGQLFQPVTGSVDAEDVDNINKGDKLQTILFGTFDKHGNISSFYLPQKQKNLLKLFFDVPDSPINENTTWKRHLYLTQIGERFIPTSAKRLDINRLIETTRNSEGDLHAHIGGIARETIDGSFELLESGLSVPVSNESTYYSYGVFNVTHGYWERNTTVSYINVKDSGLYDVSVNAMIKIDN
jgi:hypothetical protein